MVSGEDSSTEPGRGKNISYTSQFRQHLAEVRAHLAGQRDGKPFRPSYIPPTGYWTSSEKETLFHSISIHSRFRPDLIAACIGTKSTVDVCTYIDALDKALPQYQDFLLQRAEIEGAMEVSESWVQREEKEAANLVSLEYEWEERILEQERMSMEEDEIRHWNQEKMLRALDIDHLKVLGGIVYNAELRELREEPTSQPDTSGRASIDDAMIDPVLLKISQPQPVPLSNSALQRPDVASPQTSTCTPQPRVHFPEQHSNISPHDHATIPLELSPISRRRLQKRLYMRKKRAEKAGTEVVAAVTKLRPGRVPKPRLPKPRPKSYHTKQKAPEEVKTDLTPPTKRENIDEEYQESEEMQEEPYEYTSHSKSGLNKPYKIRQRLASQGIDSSILMQGDLTLLHLSNLGRLMTLYSSGYSEGVPPTTSLISADTIRLMSAIIVEFTSEAVHRIIVSHEQDRAMKGNIKIYSHLRDDITPENVDHVLEMMGMKGMTKKKYFAELLQEEEVSVTLESEQSDEEQRSNNGPLDEENENTEVEISMDATNLSENVSFPALFPLHRELHPPLIHLPKSLMPSLAQESLMPVYIDEGGLLEELEEEEELDNADSCLESQYEADLWKQFGGE